MDDTSRIIDAHLPRYAPPPLKGERVFDRRAVALDAAATAFLRSNGKRGRTHERDYTTADKRAVTAGSKPVMRPNRTLTRNGGQRMVGVRTSSTRTAY